MGRPLGLIVRDIGGSESEKGWESSDIGMKNKCVIYKVVSIWEKGKGTGLTKHPAHVAICYTRNFLLC